MNAKIKDSSDAMIRIFETARKRVAETAPPSAEDRKLQERLHKWLAELPAVSAKATQMIAAGRENEAKKLVEDFNASKPRRPAGRPKRPSIPKTAVLRRSLEEALIDEGLRTFSPETIDQIINTAIRTALSVK